MNFEDTFIGRPNTVAAYKSLFKHHIKNQLDDRAKDWNDHCTISMLTLWNSKGLSRKTKQMLLRLLRDYIEFQGGPTINIKPYIRSIQRSEQEKEVIALNKDEAKHLMFTCEQVDPNFYPILLLGLHAGLRRGEVFGLRCSDIDMFKNRIRVAHSYDGPTKSGKTRYVPMSKELERVMVKARNLLLRPSDTKIFESMDPNPRLRNVLKKANLPTIRFHDLRHTFATLALENGVSPRKVADWLGHSSVSTTFETYWNAIRSETKLDFLPGGTE
jgi:integrase